MTAPVLTLAAHDARLQYRYGIYAAYAFVVAFYVLVLTLGGPHLPAWVLGAIIYSDPAAVGFFFLGALMMLEKAEGVRTALAAAPVSAVAYFGAKALTLTGLSLLACSLLLVVTQHVATAPLLLATVALTSLAYLGIGAPIALRFRTVNAYLIGGGGLLTPVILPAVLAFIDPMPAWAMFIPPAAQARLMLVATGYGSASAVETAIMLLVATITAGAAIAYAIRDLKREFGK